jgi:alpha-L-rhamnosidase
MGLLEPTDWTAQWLAAEDRVAQSDREAGLRWIWGGTASDSNSRKFRLTFNLPAPATGGELLAVVNDWYWWTQIGGLWIDGKPMVRPRAWVDLKENHRLQPSESIGLSRVQLALEQLHAGLHVIAVEVNTGQFFTGPPDLLQRPVQSLAVFARLELQNGEILRIGSGPAWKTSQVPETAWHAPGYDDASWSEARTVSLKDYQPWPVQPAMRFRHSFAVGATVVEARLYATALGAYEARLNGQRVGDALLTPEPSQYAKRVLYRVYDVTALLRPGQNVLGLTVGDGWYAGYDGRFAWAPPPRRALAQLELIFADRSRQVIATGPGWRAAQSPIRSSEIKNGEVYDGRIDQPGWDTERFDDGQWHAAHIAETPPCRLVAQTSPPIRVMRTLRPRQISQPRPGVYLVDFGQHFSGACRLRVTGSRGTVIELKYGENITASGEVSHTGYDTAGGGSKRDLFILSGDPAGESFAPLFCYRGFRYVEIRGLEAAPATESIDGLFMHSDLAVTGQIRCDVPLIEQIWRNILQTQKSNFVGIPTDNCTREFRGYTADAATFWGTAAFNMDLCAFTSRYIDNVVDDQTVDGAFPIFSPRPHNNSALFSNPGVPPGWGDAGIIIPWVSWLHYADLDIVERNWAAMNKYLSFILRHNPDFIWKHQRSLDFGDWLAQSPSGSFDRGGLNPLFNPDVTPTTPLDLIGTAYWAHSTDLLAQMSEAIGREEDAARLRALFDKIRQAFNDAFVRSDGTVGNGSQTSHVLALAFGLLPEERCRDAISLLVADIRQRGTLLTTGILGTQFALDALADAGHADLAYDLVLRTEYPSWGYMVRNGATTIWEQWDGQGARNQYAFGSVGGFLFRHMAGIKAQTPGFEAIVIRPQLSSRVARGGGDYHSVMGRISTDWTCDGDEAFALEVTIPANVTAHVHLPAGGSSRLMESGQAVAEREDMFVVKRSDREAIVAVGSGTYRFMVSGSRPL